MEDERMFYCEPWLLFNAASGLRGAWKLLVRRLLCLLVNHDWEHVTCLGSDRLPSVRRCRRYGRILLFGGPDPFDVIRALKQAQREGGWRLEYER